MVIGGIYLLCIQWRRSYLNKRLIKTVPSLLLKDFTFKRLLVMPKDSEAYIEEDEKEGKKDE